MIIIFYKLKIIRTYYKKGYKKWSYNKKIKKNKIFFFIKDGYGWISLSFVC